MPQLLRDNAADPRVGADLETLASQYDDAAVAAAAADAAQARSDDLARLTAAYAGVSRDPQPWWRPVLANVSRYRTFYGIGVAILAVLLFRGPVPVPSAEEPEATATIADGGEPGATAPATDVGAFPVQSPLAFAAPDALSSPLDPASVAPVIATAPSAPPVLRILQSGYASTFAGTPLEQAPPGDGLPVEALANSTTKLSFVRLGGGGRTLRMRMLTDSGASLNDAVAELQACHITTGTWAPTRGMPTSDAPAYDSGDCVQGARDSSGVWTFTFVLDDPLDRNGWALVPITARNGTFRVTLSPNAA